MRTHITIDVRRRTKSLDPMQRDGQMDEEFEVRLHALKIAEKRVGSRVRSQRVSVRQKALLEVAALAETAEIKELARKQVRAKKAPKATATRQ